MNSNFEQFKPYLSNYVKNQPFIADLKMATDGTLDVYYSPFDAINHLAKVCIVGISPGKTQADNANACACEWINSGSPSSVILAKAKETASFSGALRHNLVALLDYVGLSAHLGLETASQLFSTDQHLLHSTSVFRYPVLLNGKPISSAQQGLKLPILKAIVDNYLAAECQSLPTDVLFIPLGKGTENILIYLANQGFIKHQQILVGFPHPSGANAERLAYFMGKKNKQDLSVKTNSETLDYMKSKLFQQLAEVGIKTPCFNNTVYSMPQLPLDARSQIMNQTIPNRQMSLGTKRLNIQKSDLRSPTDGFMLESVEKQLRSMLSAQGLTLNPIKSRTSKELAVTFGGVVIAYISRKTGLKDAHLTVCLHPKYKEKMDIHVSKLDNVNIKAGRGSRYISSSNYLGFNSKGYSAEVESNEHIAIAYSIDVSNDYEVLVVFFNQYLEVM